MTRAEKQAESPSTIAAGPTPSDEVRSGLDATLSQLAARSDVWAETGSQERVTIIKQVLADFLEVAPDWVEIALTHKDATGNQHARGQEWMAGPVVTVRLLQALKKTLLDVRTNGSPGRAGPVGQRLGRRGEQAIVPIFPSSNYDLLVATGTSVEVAAALERAVEDLEYGTVAINSWSGLSWSLAKAPWGSYPGHEMHGIRSGIGFVHNPLRLAGVEKTVLRAPFKTFPTPPWFALNKRYGETARNLLKLESRPDPIGALKLMSSAIRGWL